MCKRKRVLSIGDIHGEFKKLKTLLKKAAFNPEEDLLVYLGDYIDRGPEPIACLQFIMKQCAAYPRAVVALKGNHKAIMQQYFSGHSITMPMETAHIWMNTNTGGAKTFLQLQQLYKKSEDQYAALMRFVENLPVSYWVDGRFFFAHAGVNPAVPLRKQKEDDLLRIGEYFCRQYEGECKIIVGHHITGKVFETDKPYFYKDKIIFCDTGVGSAINGKLSCVDVLTGTFWQV